MRICDGSLKGICAWARATSAALALMWMSACGGGGSADAVAPVNPPVVNTAPVAQAGSAQSVLVGAVVTLDGSASTDAQGDPLSFSWTLSTRPAGSQAALSSPTAARPTFTADREGVYVASLVVSDGRLDSAPATVTVTASAAPPSAPQIVLGAAEPLSGTVQLSLTSTQAGAVTWYLDLKALGPGGTGAFNPITWNTTGVANGTHQIVARVQTGPDTFLEVRRNVTVSNSTVSLSAVVSGTTGTIRVGVSATSLYGIASVSATFDGIPAGTLTAPNACSVRLCSVNDLYVFTVDAAAARSGDHVMEFTATDGAGSSQKIRVPVPIANPPAVSIAAPTDGALLYGRLQVSGTASTDRASALTVVVTLGDVPLLQTTLAAPGGSFSAAYDLSGLAPNAYLLTVTVSDNGGLRTVLTRTVFVTASASQALPVALALPPGARLLASDGAQAVYQAGDSSVRLRTLGQATEVSLAGAAGIQYANDWAVSGGRVVVYGKGPDCINYCIYQWAADGTLKNLSNDNPWSAASNIGGGRAADQHPVAKGGYVVWVNDNAADAGTLSTGRYTVHHVASGTYTRVGVPAGVERVGNWQYDFEVVDGVVHFYFWGQTGGSGTTAVWDVFKWRSDTGASVRLTAGGARSIYVNTDGVRAAWQQTPLGGSTDNTYTLVTQPLGGGPLTAVASPVTQHALRDGVLAWVEAGAGGTRALRAVGLAGTPVTLSLLSSTTLLGITGGHVVYNQQGRIWAWNAATGAARVLLETTPTGGTVFLANGLLVFTLVSSVYVLPVN